MNIKTKLVAWAEKGFLALVFGIAGWGLKGVHENAGNIKALQRNQEIHDALIRADKEARADFRELRNTVALLTTHVMSIGKTAPKTYTPERSSMETAQQDLSTVLRKRRIRVPKLVK